MWNPWTSPYAAPLLNETLGELREVMAPYCILGNSLTSCIFPIVLGFIRRDG